MAVYPSLAERMPGFRVVFTGKIHRLPFAHLLDATSGRNILKLEEALWTFVTVPGVEPTNNIAERALRRLVLWRRRSFGTKSEAGSRFVERTMTAVATLRQQKRDVLDHLTEACAAALRGDRAPSLLPDHSVVSEG